jgi:hypothetical protein
MVRLKLILVSVLVIIVNYSIITAQETTLTNIDVIYLLDISRSMNQEGLFQNIKERLKQLIEERKNGDRVILGTFSDDVLWPVQVDIRDIEDIKDIKKIIDNLKAEGEWTWLAKALKETKEKAQDLKTRSPGKTLIIYMLTDCINDPPPEIKKIEPPWDFVEVVLQYFEDYKTSDTFIYLLSYRPLKPGERKELTARTHIIPIEPQGPLPIPRIRVSFTGFNFDEVNLSKGEVTCPGEIIIDDIQDIHPGEQIHLISQEPFKVNPESIICKEVGHKETIHITIPTGLQPGEHVEQIQLSAPRAAVEPSRLVFSFVIPGASKTGAMNDILKLIFLLLVVVLLFILYDAILREKSVWLEYPAEERTEEAKLKGWNKTYLGEKAANKYIDLKLPDHYIQRERFKNSIFSVQEGEQKTKISFGEDIQYRDTEGNEVILRFHQKQPLETSQEKSQEESDISSPLDDIFGKK